MFLAVFNTCQVSTDFYFQIYMNLDNVFLSSLFDLEVLHEIRNLRLVLSSLVFTIKVFAMF